MAHIQVGIHPLFNQLIPRRWWISTLIIVVELLGWSLWAAVSLSCLLLELSSTSFLVRQERPKPPKATHNMICLRTRETLQSLLVFPGKMMVRSENELKTANRTRRQRRVLLGKPHNQTKISWPVWPLPKLDCERLLVLAVSEERRVLLVCFLVRRHDDIPQSSTRIFFVTSFYSRQHRLRTTRRTYNLRKKRMCHPINTILCEWKHLEPNHPFLEETDQASDGDANVQNRTNPILHLRTSTWAGRARNVPSNEWTSNHSSVPLVGVSFVFDVRTEEESGEGGC